MTAGRLFPGATFHGRPFVHVDGVVRAVGRRHSLTAEEVFPIGEPDTYSYDTLQRVIARELLHEDNWETEEIPKALAKSGAWIEDKIPGIEEPFIKPWMTDMADDHCELDIAKARKLLGWQPDQRLISTLPAICQALLDDPIAWYRRHGFPASSIPATVHSH